MSELKAKKDSYELIDRGRSDIKTVHSTVTQPTPLQLIRQKLKHGKRWYLLTPSSLVTKYDGVKEETLWVVQQLKLYWG